MPSTCRQKTKVICIAALFLMAARATSFAADEMVEISVEVTEINNNKANDLGIKWFDKISFGETGGGTAGAFGEVPSLLEVRNPARFTPLTAELELLLKKGAAKILSKPKLITKSGTSAKFLVGGEIPIVAVGNVGGTVEWKQYGIRCEILPRVYEKSIDFILFTEVSRLDWMNQVNGYPAIMKREASSSIKINDGQTIALAGLVETTKEEQTLGIPLLSEIPVIGVLFGKKKFVDNKTTVLIFVTPRIIE